MSQHKQAPALLKLSKAVSDGTVVVQHGDKFVRCGPRRRPFGIFQVERRQRVLTDTGYVDVVRPRGIVVHGYAEARMVSDRSTT